MGLSSAAPVIKSDSDFDDAENVPPVQSTAGKGKEPMYNATQPELKLKVQSVPATAALDADAEQTKPLLHPIDGSTTDRLMKLHADRVDKSSVYWTDQPTSRPSTMPATEGQKFFHLHTEEGSAMLDRTLFVEWTRMIMVAEPELVVTGYHHDNSLMIVKKFALSPHKKSLRKDDVSCTDFDTYGTPRLHQVQARPSTLILEPGDEVMRIEWSYYLVQAQPTGAAGRISLDPKREIFSNAARLQMANESNDYYCFEIKQVQEQRTKFEVRVFVDLQKVSERFKAGLKVSGMAMFRQKFFRMFPAERLAGYKLKDTYQNVEMDPPEGFGLQLRPYQKRTLAWLTSLEREKERTVLKVMDAEDEFIAQYRSRVRLVPGGPYFAYGQLFAEDPWPVVSHGMEKSIRCQGAILADDTGTGKTVTVLALIHANRFSGISDLHWASPRDRLHYIPSESTLVVCPAHLAVQWKDEALRCLPNCRVKLLTTIHDHRKLTWNEILLADIVIVSLSFLQNVNYKNRVEAIVKESDSENLDAYMSNLRRSGREVYGGRRNEVIFERIMWWRCVSDEFHELGLNKKTKQAAKFFCSELCANFYLGVTGTPMYNTVEEVTAMATFLNTKLPATVESAKMFLERMVRRNEPNLKLPPLIQQLIWVDLSPQEMGLFHGNRGTARDALMACNHHQLVLNLPANDTESHHMTINEVSGMVQKARERSMANSQELIKQYFGEMNYHERLVERYSAMMANGRTHITIDGNKHYLRILLPQCQGRAEVQRQLYHQEMTLLRNTRAQHTFFQSVLDTVNGTENQQCLVCFEDIGRNVARKVSIPYCGHLHCNDCMAIIMRQTPKQCSMCRYELTEKQVYSVDFSKADVAANDAADASAPDYNQYGSKLAAFVQFVRKTTREEPDAKIILFIQFERLMMLVSRALHEFNVNHVRVFGQIMVRTKAIREFKTSKDVRLILLSSEDSVSGLHLVEGTHVVVFHPFSIADNDALAIAYEKQGIARAWRGGQTHPVKLVRFLARGTLEQELAEKRGYRDGENIENIADFDRSIAPKVFAPPEAT